MDGNQFLLELLTSLTDYLSLTDQDLDDALYIDQDIIKSLGLLKGLVGSTSIMSFIISLEKLILKNENNFLNTLYSLSGVSTQIIDFMDAALLTKNRSFAYSNTEIGFVSSKAIFDDNDDVVDFVDLPNIWKQIEEYLVTDYSNNSGNNINDFFTIIENIDKEKGFLINKTTNTINTVEHYSFVYLSYINESNSIIVPNDLKYTIGSLSGSFSYDSTKNYSQFFDIYDVVNELNQAPDILSRFLKLYHALEYLAYRVYLVDLVNRVGNGKIFVREFIKASEDMKKAEKASFLKNFKKIFDSDMATISPALLSVTSRTVKSFLNDRNIVENFREGNTISVAELIYGLRCSIVHNKESEYHITISNHEEYRVIIPLIRKTLETFEDLLIKKLKDNDGTIKYPRPSMALY